MVGPGIGGLLIAVTGIAAVVSSFLLASRKPPRDYPRRTLLAWTAGAAPLALMVFAPSFWLLLPLGAVYGFFSTAAGIGSSREFMIWLFVLGGTLPVLLTLVTLRWVDLRGLGAKGAHQPETQKTPEHAEPVVPV